MLSATDFELSGHVQFACDTARASELHAAVLKLARVTDSELGRNRAVFYFSGGLSRNDVNRLVQEMKARFGIRKGCKVRPVWLLKFHLDPALKASGKRRAEKALRDALGRDVQDVTWPSALPARSVQLVLRHEPALKIIETFLHPPR